MLVGEARQITRDWISQRVGGWTGFYGAYFAGSANDLPDSAVFPSTSDLDVNVVFRDGGASARGKFLVAGVTIEVTSLALDDVRTPEQVLAHYHLAGGLRAPSVLLDPSGHLTRLQAVVSREFARRDWVLRRCAHARGRILEQLDALDQIAPIHDQAIGWLFPTGVLTHVLLVAGLRNPTVRRRYVAARELLSHYGQFELHEQLLEVLGCARMSRERVAQHLARLAPAFDAACASIRTPVPFATDISELARPMEIEGSRELVERGLHREAVFWIAVTFSRCQKVLAADAPPSLRERIDPAYRDLLADLGIASAAVIRQRAEEVRSLVPRVWTAAEAIVAANPEIREQRLGERPEFRC